MMRESNSLGRSKVVVFVVFKLWVVGMGYGWLSLRPLESGLSYIALLHNQWLKNVK